jgi:ABC-type uncharacterized transport system ATPase subunit
MTDTITVNEVSKWFGLKVAVSEVTIGFGPGVTGLLGPNGAGKTTSAAHRRSAEAPRASASVRSTTVRHRCLPKDVTLPEDESPYDASQRAPIRGDHGLPAKVDQPMTVL